MTTEHILRKYNIKTDVIEIPNANREDLAQLLHELDFKVGVEVGVAAGEYSHTIAKYNPQMKLYGVDPYISYSGYKDYVKESTFKSLESTAKELLKPYPQYEFIKKTSLEACEDFEDESLDFVYIDANHAEPFVTQDINAWAKKVRKGGIVAGHDYARIKAKGDEDSSNWAVIPAIHKYAEENGVQLLIWGLEAKIPPLKRDPIRSWSFVK